MIFIERHAEASLIEWKNTPDRKPLVIRGARQVGKSALIENFGERYFKQTHVFNFEEKKELKKVFAGDFDIDKILSQLEVYAGTEIDLKHDLIFFDEIQECPLAISCLRYFREKKLNTFIIAAGSLLEFALERVSIPVGRIEFLTIYPLNFEEFLAATNRKILFKALPRLNEDNLNANQLTAAAASALYEALREYSAIGGMPECVASFAAHKSFERVRKIQWSLVESFEADVLKYAKGELQISNLQSTWVKLSKMVGSEITYSTINPDDDHKRTKNSIALLAKAKLIHIVQTINAHGLPLGGSADEKHFKCLFLDIGLMFHLAGGRYTDLVVDGVILDAMEGRLAEQFVGQQLLAGPNAGSERGVLYCWFRSQKGAKAEIDYLIARSGKIVPVEVKAGKGGKLRSLLQYIKTYPKTEQAICLQERNDVHIDRGVTYAPLFSIL
ncbi:MAG: AAA family ATPase [Proteobacteria bacterium]|nr:AAA family ATPase [Pseudomonadota bacterium]